MPKVYFDNAATTSLRPEVLVKMVDILKNDYGNPSSTHSYGRNAKNHLEKARKDIAKLLNVKASEIIFTSGGTEADNLVLQSAVKDLKVDRIITSKVEHHAVLHTVQELEEKYPCQVEYVKVKSCGSIDLQHLEDLLSDQSEKTLVSLMHINNEIGTILDLERVGNLCRKYDTLFHSDMVQSIGHFKVDLGNLPVDFVAASAHKFHGPKGVGFAFLRKNTGVKGIILGGEQERGFRAGTEGIHNIVGMAEALSYAQQNYETERQYIQELKAYFIQQLKANIPKVIFNANCDQMEYTTYTLVNICLPVPEEKASLLLFQLDMEGIACSRGSACQSGSSKGSHVLQEILAEENLKKPSLRFSFSINNTKEEIDYTVKVLKNHIASVVAG